MKRTTCNHWCHLVCALWTPETIFNGQLVEGVSTISKASWQSACILPSNAKHVLKE